MSDRPTQEIEPVPLYEAFDDAGRAFLDEFVRIFNDGGYTEAVEVLLADEAEVSTVADE